MPRKAEHGGCDTKIPDTGQGKNLSKNTSPLVAVQETRWAQAMPGGAQGSVHRWQLGWFRMSSSPVLGLSDIISKTMALYLRWWPNWWTFMPFSPMSHLILQRHNIPLKVVPSPGSLYICFSSLLWVLKTLSLLHKSSVHCILWPQMALVIFCCFLQASFSPLSHLDSGYVWVTYLSLSTEDRPFIFF